MTDVSTQVRSIINNRLGRTPTGYERVVDGVVTDVTELSYRLFDQLCASGERLGASHEQVVNALQSAGLRQRPQPPRPTTPTAQASPAASRDDAPVTAGEFRSFAQRVDEFLRRFGRS